MRTWLFTLVIILGAVLAAGSAFAWVQFMPAGGESPDAHVSRTGALTLRGDGLIAGQNLTLEADRNAEPYGSLVVKSGDGIARLSYEELRRHGLVIEDGDFRLRAFDESGRQVWPVVTNQLTPDSGQVIEVKHVYPWPTWAYPSAWGTATLLLGLLAMAIIATVRREPSEDPFDDRQEHRMRRPMSPTQGPSPPPAHRSGLVSPLVPTLPQGFYVDVVDGTTRLPLPQYSVRINGQVQPPRGGNVHAHPGDTVSVSAPGYAVAEFTATGQNWTVPLAQAQQTVQVTVVGKASQKPLAKIPVIATADGETLLAEGVTNAQGTVALQLPQKPVMVGTALNKDGFIEAQRQVAGKTPGITLEVAFQPVPTGSQTEELRQLVAEANGVTSELAGQDTGVSILVKEAFSEVKVAIDEIEGLGAWFLTHDAAPVDLRTELLQDYRTLIEDFRALSHDKVITNELAARAKPINPVRGARKSMDLVALAKSSGPDSVAQECLTRLPAFDQLITTMTSRQTTVLLSSVHQSTGLYARNRDRSNLESQMAFAIALQARVTFLERLVRGASP